MTKFLYFQYDDDKMRYIYSSLVHPDVRYKLRVSEIDYDPTLCMRQHFGDVTKDQWRYNQPTYLRDYFIYFVLFHRPFVAGIDLPHPGIADSYIQERLKVDNFRSHGRRHSRSHTRILFY